MLRAPPGKQSLPAAKVVKRLKPWRCHHLPQLAVSPIQPNLDAMSAYGACEWNKAHGAAPPVGDTPTMTSLYDNGGVVQLAGVHGPFSPSAFLETLGRATRADQVIYKCLFLN